MINFTKMEGIGNDGIYVDCTKQKIQNPGELAYLICDRYFGIGANGLILIFSSKIADFRIEIYNSDGSQAEMCGNGIRCVGKFVYEKGLTNKTELEIETLAGIKKLKLNVENGVVKTVRADMGEPIFEAEKIPVICDQKGDLKKIKLQAYDKQFEVTCVSVGNPHGVIFVKDVDAIDVRKYGQKMENDKAFPQKANIEFIEKLDDHNIRMRVWERGAGETMACGTGACASTVASVLNKITSNQVTVHLQGGSLSIEWNREDNHIYMTGPAEITFEGTFDEEKYRANKITDIYIKNANSFTKI